MGRGDNSAAHLSETGQPKCLGIDCGPNCVMSKSHVAKKNAENARKKSEMERLEAEGKEWEKLALEAKRKASLEAEKKNMEKIEKEVEPAFKCAQCSQKFWSTNRLEYHINEIHEKEGAEELR